MASLASAVWTPVLPNLSSIIVVDDPKANLAELPGIFSAAENCRYVSVVAATLGTANKPAALPHCVAGADKLYLSTQKLHVRVKDVKCSRIFMAGVYELNIRRVSAQLSQHVLSGHHCIEKKAYIAVHGCF